MSNISCISEQSRDIQEVLSLIPHCRTVYCCRVTSPSTSATSGTQTTCTLSSRVDWFQEEKVSWGTGSQCLSQPWTRCTPIRIWKGFSTIWKKPRITVYKNTRRVHQNTLYVGAIWNSLREMDCSSMKHDATQSFFSTQYLRYVLRKWCIWRLQRIYTAQYTNPQGYREPTLFASNIHFVCHRKFRTAFTRIQAPGKTNDREKIVERILQHFLNYFHIILHFSSHPIQCR